MKTPEICDVAVIGGGPTSSSFVGCARWNGLTTKRAEEVRMAIGGQAFEHRGRPLPRVTISAGVAGFPGDGDTVDGLLKAADVALYQAKDLGRDRVCVAPGSGSAV